MGFFSKKTSTFDPMSLFTDAQKQSVGNLQSLANTGSGGGLTLGEDYTGSLGEFTQNAGELAALERLRGLAGGNNADIDTARGAFNEAATTTFNPDDPSSGFAAFSRALAKSGGEAQDKLNQQAAISGGVFGSGRGRDTASLQADMANQRGSYLANLFSQAQDRKLQGAKGLQDVANQEVAFNQQLQQQESVERLLKDKKANAEMNEFKRARGEELQRIGLMQNEASNPLGIRTRTEASTFSKLAPSLIGAAGSIFGGPIGGMVGSKLGGLFGGGSSSGQSFGLGADTRKFSGNGVTNYQTPILSDLTFKGVR